MTVCMEAPIKTKLCGSCGQQLPLEQFPKRYKVGEQRHSKCRECQNAYHSLRRKRLRRQRIGKYLSQVNLYKAEPSRVEALTIAMIKRFEGMGNLVSEWRQWHQDASDARKHDLTLRSFLAMFHLIEAANALQAKRQPDLSRMDERELSTYQDNQVRKLIRRNPAIAVKAAVEMGWHVIPPPDVPDDDKQEGATE